MSYRLDNRDNEVWRWHCLACHRQGYWAPTRVLAIRRWRTHMYGGHCKHDCYKDVCYQEQVGAVCCWCGRVLAALDET